MRRFFAAPVGMALCMAAMAQGAELPTREQLVDAQKSVDAAGAEVQRMNALLDFVAASLAAEATPELAAAEKAVAELQAKQKAAIEEAGLSAVHTQLQNAQKERTAAVEALLADAPAYQAAVKKAAGLREKAAAMSPRLATLTPEEVDGLKKMLVDADGLERAMGAAQRALWNRGEVEAAYKKADTLYKQYNDKAGKVESLKAIGAELRAGRQKVEALRRAIVEGDARYKAWAGVWVGQLAAAEEARTGAAAKLAELRKGLLGDAQWTAEISVAQSPDKAGKPRPDNKASLFIPPHTKKVRAIIMGHPPMLGTGVPSSAEVRTEAALSDLAILNFQGIDALFTYTTDTPARLQKVLDGLAEKTGHPEIASAPFITVGHSTSGIYARNVAYWNPSRTLGVIHIKSGNMHQHRPDPAKSFAGVPFLAINGEFEEFGPEGGIRKEYGAQTQWVMIREQLLRMRGMDPEYLLSLVVHPGAGHGNFSPELSRYSALFIQKTARYRLNADGTTRAIKAEEGWLTDSDLDFPTHAPGAYAQYAGDKVKAFWHYDEEMARATAAYHAGRFLLPDPTKKSPVPADWASFQK